MNYCTNCGYKLEIDDNFCPNCGIKIEDGNEVIEDKDFFLKYEVKISELKQDYDSKMERAVLLIKKQFSPADAGYGKFMSTINNSNNTFYNNVEVALTILDTASESTFKIKKELDRIIGVLREIIVKMNDLINELVIHLADKSKTKLDSLTKELDDLINSVKEY